MFSTMRSYQNFYIHNILPYICSFNQKLTELEHPGVSQAICFSRKLPSDSEKLFLELYLFSVMSLGSYDYRIIWQAPTLMEPWRLSTSSNFSPAIGCENHEHCFKEQSHQQLTSQVFLKERKEMQNRDKTKNDHKCSRPSGNHSQYQTIYSFLNFKRDPAILMP